MEPRFTWDDSVRVIDGAPESCRPGASAAVVGISEEHERSDLYRARFPSGTVYTIEFEDGSDAEIEERFLLREVVLRASGWSNKEDFYRDLLAELKAPEWHGHNLDALEDSIVTGGINGVEAPFAIRIVGNPVGRDAQHVVDRFSKIIQVAAAKGCPVSIEREIEGTDDGNC